MSATKIVNGIVTSINVGIESLITGPDFRAKSGIVKQCASRAVQVGELGLEGDVIVHTHVHGGRDQAVYAYRAEDYDWCEQQLGSALLPGQFGENLTLRGLPGADVVIGSRFRFAEVLLEVTAPRIPCSTFAARMGDPAFLKRFMRAERPGIYFRVIEAGWMAAGESFAVEPYAGDSVSILEIFRASHARLGAEQLHRFLAAPIDERTRDDFNQRLAKLSG